MIYYFILVVMAFLGSLASLFLKKASSTENICKIFSNKNLYLGGVLYFVSALLNIYILKYLDYSIVLPLTSITYIWTMALSYIILREKISHKKIIGVVLILVGAVIVSMAK